jgi:hypothetical protein
MVLILLRSVTGWLIMLDNAYCLRHISDQQHFGSWLCSCLQATVCTTLTRSALQRPSPNCTRQGHGRISPTLTSSSSQECSVSSFATLRVVSCRHSPELRCSYCNTVRFSCDIETRTFMAATIKHYCRIQRVSRFDLPVATLFKTKCNNQTVSMMTGVELTPKTMCISNISRTIGNVQRGIRKYMVY